jgi:formylglycine-generating enzyme required for sulfatase activity
MLRRDMRDMLQQRFWRTGSAALLMLLGTLLAGCDASTPLGNNPSPGRIFSDCSGCPEMVVIPAGSFEMGSPPNEVGRQQDEGPQHRVTIAMPFAVGRFEVTTAQYRLFATETGRPMGTWNLGTTSDVTSGNYPVRWVSWLDAQAYVSWLSKRSGKHYRLLSEAEWEYTARAGNTDRPWEPDDTRHGRVGVEFDRFHETSPVGSYEPNAFGVFDMTGNIPEWTEDCYQSDYSQSPADGSAVEGSCAKRVVRGAYNFSAPEFQRVANRDWNYAVDANEGNPTGFRVAMSLP